MEKLDYVRKLLFEIYNAGVQNKTIDLTGYLNDITKALSLHFVVGQSEQLPQIHGLIICECNEVYDTDLEERCPKCGN